MTRTLYLTFDVEDIVNKRSIFALEQTLECLKKERLRGLFFITGGMAEKLKNLGNIVSKLYEHEIGFHSSNHSIRPIILEYTDVIDYQNAVEIAHNREMSHIDSLTGKMDGEGGLITLRELFPNKEIISFRAPGFSWSPPHLEALKKLGVKYDFSSAISSRKFSHKGITFFPFPLEIMPPEGNPLTISLYRRLLWRILSQRTVVIVMHPHSLVNAEPWDALYWRGNPKQLGECSKKDFKKINNCIFSFNKFIKFLSNIKKIGLAEISPPLTPAPPLVFSSEMVYTAYLRSISWSNQFFNYNPTYVFDHFKKFFDIT